MTTPPSSIESAAPQPARMGDFARLTGVLFSPKATFQDIAARPSWVAPMIVMILISLALSIVLGTRLDWMAVARRNIERSSFASAQMEKAPPDQREKAYERQATIQKITRYVRGVIGTPLLTLFLAAIYLVVFNLIAGARAKFEMAFTLVTFSLIPIALREILAIPIVFLRDPTSIDPENIVASNFGAFLSGDAPLWLVALGRSVDLFGLWAAVLTAIGFAATYPKKVRLGTALSIVFGVYVVFTLLGVGIAGAFS